MYRTLLDALLVLVISGDLMLVFSVLKLLPWRVSTAFTFLGSFLSGITVAVMEDLASAGVFAVSAGVAAFLWRKHRNDDDDDDTTRRRRRIRSKLRSHLPKPNGFDRPVPALDN
jgi:Na+/H+ antiporter NhaB